MEFLEAHWFEVATGIAVVGLLVYNIVLSARLSAYKKMARLLAGGTLEEHINSIEKRYLAQQGAIVKNEAGISALQKHISRFPQHWHLVRYNAFEKAGSDLSFSLALLDDGADGFVLTGIFGREDTRVYAKPILKGESKYSLSEEEISAIKTAMK